MAKKYIFYIAGKRSAILDTNSTSKAHKLCRSMKRQKKDYEMYKLNSEQRPQIKKQNEEEGDNG